MGKRKDRTSAADSDPPHKKSKHKHKKHKKKRERSSSASEEIDVVGIGDGRPKDEGKSMLKLKIRLGGQTLSTAEVIPIKRQVPQVDEFDTDDLHEHDDGALEHDLSFTEERGTTEDVSYQKQLKQADQDSYSVDSSSYTQEDDVDSSTIDVKESTEVDEEEEEEKWLEALEKGELEEYTPPSKRKKDISLMTARQRALYGHSIEGETELMELPLWSKRRDEDSEEAQTRRKQRAKKRKQQMQKQIEDSKVQTINKLLNKQGVKGKKEEKNGSKENKQQPHSRYLNNANGVFLCYTEGMDFPLASKKKSEPRAVPVHCAARGCKNIKKYACSKTLLPVCSLKCYKKVQAV